LSQELEITLKPLSETQWEWGLHSVKAIRFQLDNICEAIENLRDSSDDSANVNNCESVLNEMTTIGFVLSLIIWYEILFLVNGLNHLWQNVETHLHNTVTHLRQFSAWLDQYYSTGFETALKEAHEFAGNSKYDIPLTSKEKIIIRGERMFDYENGDEPVTNPENRFRIEYFNVMANKITSNLQTRFESFAEFFDKFGFVFEVSNLRKMSKEELLKHCQDLKTVLFVADDCDVDCCELFEELQVLSSEIPSHISDIRNVFKFNV
jgi:hypothetical protein